MNAVLTIVLLSLTAVLAQNVTAGNSTAVNVTTQDVCVLDRASVYQYPVICSAPYPTYNSSYRAAVDLNLPFYLYDVYTRFVQLFPDSSNTSSPSYLSTYPCSKALSELFCSQIYPRCNDTDPTANKTLALPCSSQCLAVVEACPQNLTDWWNSAWVYVNAPDSRIQFPFPTIESCYSANYSSDGAHCTNLTSSQTTMVFMYDFDNANVTYPTPSPSPTPGPTKHYRPKSTPPPNSYFVKGGLLGAGVLVMVMLLMAGLMFIMKKQDQR